MYIDTLTTFVFLSLYLVSLIIVYRKGSSDMKVRYSSLINRLHREYVAEMSRTSNILDSLDDIENTLTHTLWRVLPKVSLY